MQSPFPLHLVLPHSAWVYPILVPNVAYALPKFGLHAGGALLHCTPLALLGTKDAFIIFPMRATTEGAIALQLRVSKVVGLWK